MRRLLWLQASCGGEAASLHDAEQLDLLTFDLSGADLVWHPSFSRLQGQAARGLLGHCVRTEQACIRHYEIVTPTGWDLSLRDPEGRPGPLEEALVVRSYDPCLYCSVH